MLKIMLLDETTKPVVHRTGTGRREKSRVKGCIIFRYEKNDACKHDVNTFNWIRDKGKGLPFPLS
jgi:hypothetical protein